MSGKVNYIDESKTFRYIWSLLNDYLPFVSIFGLFALLLINGNPENFELLTLLILVIGPALYIFISSGRFFLSKIFGALITPFLVGIIFSIYQANGIYFNFLIILFIYSIIEGIISELSDVLGIVPKSFGLTLENINRIIWIIVLFTVLSTNFDKPFLVGSISIPRADLYILINLVISLIMASVSTILIQFRNDTLEKLSRKLKIIGSWNIDEKTIENELLNNESMQLKHVNRTIMFGDIRGFTKFSEGNHIHQVVRVLQELYDEVEKAAKRYNGSKPEFIADEFILFFDDTSDAVACGIELSKRLSAFLSKFNLGIGIGIDKGNVVEGIVGSKSSKKYTAFGVAVNTASRLQSNAEKGQILISKAVLDAAEGIEAQEVHGITMKGVNPNFQIFSLISHSPKKNSPISTIWGRFRLFKQR